jgi:hypothetical protein
VVDEQRTFSVTHPFHPLHGQQFELLSYRHAWDEYRVFFYDREGRLSSLPAVWTNVVGVDPFVVMAAGRAHFRVEDLVALLQLLHRLEAEQRATA